MASSLSRTGIEKPATGEQENTWGGTLNANFDLIEEMINGVASIDVSGSSDVTLSDAQLGHGLIILTGTLTGNISVIWPAEEYTHGVINSTDGDFTVTLKVSGQTGVVLDQGDGAHVYCDGSDVAVHVPGISGGGTGARTKAGARANLELDHNNVNLAYAGQFYS